MRHRVPLFLLSALLVGCLQEQSRLSPSPPTETRHSEPDRLLVPATNWTTRAELPTPRTEVACAALNGKIYLVGGFNQNNLALPQFDIYDPKADAWSRGADYPIAIHHTGIVAHAGALYVFGGYTGSFPFVGTTFAIRYDPATNAWTPETNLPRARGAHAVLYLAGEAHLVGGAPQQPGTETYRSVDIYNFTSRQWRSGPDLAETKEHLAGAVVDHTLVVAGGRRMSLNNFNTTETLAPGQAQWQSRQPMPTARGGIAAAALTSYAVFFGGERSGGTFVEAEAFETLSGRWGAFAPMPHGRHGLCAATLDDGIHVIAGGPQPGLTVSGHHEVLAFSTP